MPAKRRVCRDRLHLLDAAELHRVSDRGGGAVRVDVVHLLLSGDLVGHRHRHLHAALSALAAGSDHVVAVGVGAIARDLGVDLSAARLCGGG